MTDPVATPASFVVTGGAGGIGRAVAEELSRVGEVVVVDHGPDGIRTNALALGTISTARHDRCPTQASPAT